MRDLHDHDHNHDLGHNHHQHHAHGVGHNTVKRPVQWQTPHEPSATAPAKEPEPDFDLVEEAFVAGFASAPDPTSFLRLARVPFEAMTAEGETLKLLRVETGEAVDIGAVTPRLGGGTMRYDPLPAKMVSRRRRLSFIYYDGQDVVELSFTEALALKT